MNVDLWRHETLNVGSRKEDGDKKISASMHTFCSLASKLHEVQQVLHHFTVSPGFDDVIESSAGHELIQR